LSISEAAAVLGVSRQSVYAALESGRIQEHHYEGRRCVLRAGLRRQWFNNTQLRAGSPIQQPEERPTNENLGRLVRELMAEHPEKYEWAEELSGLLNREVALDPSEWPDTPWPTWRWATVLTAISWGIETLDGTLGDA
jgi:hypothetical protein